MQRFLPKFATATFVFLSLLLCLFVFGAGLWGQSLLAPLDLASALFPQYRFLDPASTGVPANHYLHDQLMYDLPVQRTIYQSYRRGEMPWWDPYTAGGHPLLADANVNGTDPIRALLYFLLPFEMAYNWTLILRFVLCGLGMFLLLRHWNFPTITCALLAVTYQFSSVFAFHFGHPWVQAPFVYYPFLWLAWEKRRPVLAALLVACVFFAGNLQAHAYLAVFALAYLIGTGWRQSLPAVAASVAVGACLAAPILLPEIELFLISSRPILHSLPVAWLGGVVSLAAVYPWMLGTFRTLDLGKLVETSNAGFHLFIGSAGFVLAALGARGRHPLRHTALMLVGSYFVIMSTPLRDFLYDRSAPLGVMGLTVLAAIGLNALSQAGQRWARFTLILAVVLALGTNLMAFVVYPRIKDRVRQTVEQRVAQAYFGEKGRPLRMFQIENFPREISFQNPETVLATGSLLLLAAMMWRPGWRKAAPVLLALNLIPVLLYCHRFVPRAPVEQWQRLQAGGPAQRRVTAVLADTNFRLLDDAPTSEDKLFPCNLPLLYRVRTVHGFWSLMLPSLCWPPATEHSKYRAQLADYVYAGAALRKLATPGLARFQWSPAQRRAFAVEETGLNTIRVEFQAGAAGNLLWTDTPCPGWTARVDGQPVAIQFTAPSFNRIEIPATAQTLALCYRPTWFWPSLGICGAGLLALFGVSRR